MRLTDYSVVLVCTSGVLLGCAPAARTPAGSSVAQPMAQSMIASPLAQAGSSTPTAADLGRLLPTGISTASDDDALTKLWHTRTQSETLDDYPLGAGDVLQISVPNLDEIQTFGARISGEGTITLPLVGLIHAANLTEEQLRQEIRQRLEAKYMRDPQVNVFVQEYRSRQVAVIGVVQKPGLYNLTSGSNTILDLIGLAGGMGQDAASRVLLFPASVTQQGAGKTMPSPATLAAFGTGPQSSVVAKPEPVVINLQNVSQGGNQIHLTLPVRPGDVIMVPASGEVLVEGWVERPGSYKITPGLTLLGSITAAGGPHFAADTSTVELIRTTREGGKVSFVANLEKIKRGETPDVPVQEGDIVAMPSSPVKLAPYGIYSFISGMVRVGASIY